MSILYILSIIFFIIGIGIRYFKWHFLIAGYNTMSEEKKKNVDINGLSRLMGNFCFLLAILFLVGGIGDSIDNRLLSSLPLFLIFPLAIIMIVLAQRYDKNKESNAQAKVSAGIMIFIGILVFGIIVYSARGPEIEVTNDRITIKGMYGTTIDKDDIVEVSIVDSIPKVLRKTNGIDLVYILKGRFILEDIGKSVLFINENSPPYIVIKTENSTYIINYRDSNKTLELYDKLKVMD